MIITCSTACCGKRSPLPSRERTRPRLRRRALPKKALMSTSAGLGKTAAGRYVRKSKELGKTVARARILSTESNKFRATTPPGRPGILSADRSVAKRAGSIKNNEPAAVALRSRVSRQASVVSGVAVYCMGAQHSQRRLQGPRERERESQKPHAAGTRVRYFKCAQLYAQAAVVMRPAGSRGVAPCGLATSSSLVVRMAVSTRSTRAPHAGCA